MANCAQSLSPLGHAGTSQSERRLPALSETYVQIDENDYADWIVFASGFAKHLSYYSTDGAESLRGWQAFFARDVSAVLGSFAVQDVDLYREQLAARFGFLRDDDHAGEVDALRAKLSESFSLVLTLAQAIDAHYFRLPLELEFKATLGSVIGSKLGPSLRRVLAYLKGALAGGLYAPVTSIDFSVLNTKVNDALALASAGGLSQAWFDAETPDYAAVIADDSVYRGASVFEQVSHAANHFLFSSAFDGFTQAYARLIVDAEAALLKSLESNGHEPHYALFLAFLRLFRSARDQLNGIGRRHLDFYYREVLRLAPKPAKPDQVHLIAELAKGRESAALSRGTLFKGDKDSARKDRLYALDADTTFNQARVASLMALYRVEPSDLRLSSSLRSSGRLFAASVIDSSDGVGGKLTSEMGDFHPFLNATPDTSGAITEIAMPAARVGFGIASPLLFLAEGKRTLELTVKTPQPFGSFDKAKLRCRLTHPKGWFEKPVAQIEAAALEGGSAGTRLLVELEPADPAVTAFDPKLHGAGYEPGLPVVELVLKNEPGSVCGYDALKDVPVQGLEVRVTVGTTSGDEYTGDGIRQLVLAGKDGGLDPSKPFMPWGATPKAGVPFVVGSAEMFGKKGAKFNLDIAWSNGAAPAGKPAATGATLQFLNAGTWQNAAHAETGNAIVGDATQRTLTSNLCIPDAALVDDPGAPLAYDASARGGFFRLVLDGDFGHASYPTEYVKFTLAYNTWLQGDRTDTEPSPPAEPYVPLIDSISLVYSAETGVVDLTTQPSAPRAVRFYHVGPFGIAEQLLPPAGSSNHRLLPQFRSPGEPDNQAEWYIGLTGLSARQSVNLLVQVLEGTTLPLLAKPEKHVSWSYWAGDRWEPFEAGEVRDGTRQLTRSGILGFAIPDGATTDTGLMPHGLLWLRASVTAAVGAVCRVLAVHAQALHATFEDRGNAPDAMDQPVAPGTVKKLWIADAAFKKFEQPFSSFGGRPREDDAAFNLRASERLRHKGRASTIWDYEHLVLEAFPQIHRVKCLHHTRIGNDPSTGAAIHNENAPGWVSLITLPKLEGRNDTQLLKPYTQQSVLDEIQTFLRERVTGQLANTAAAPRVCVANPLFEELSVSLKLRLAAGYDDFTYYSKLLVDELMRFLSPWAFSEGLELELGGSIPKSSLVDFIDERPYVDFITDVRLRHQTEGGAPVEDLEVATASTARSVLVSAPASAHSIEPYVA